MSIIVSHPENSASPGQLWDRIGRVVGYFEHGRQRLGTRWVAVAVWMGMAAGLALCYRSGSLPLILGGLLLVGGLALLRLDVALLFVPLTAPLFLVSAALPGAVRRELLLPPHELVLLATAAAALSHAAIKLCRSSGRRRLVANLCRVRARQPSWAAAYAPELLFLAAGVLGLLHGAPEPEARRDALRAFRWFVVEPLIFVALVRLVARRSARPSAGTPYAMYLAGAFIAGGAAVASVGLLQYIGGPVPLAVHGQVAGGAWRATSVYGNPNNLGLSLGRVWPLAAALALAPERRSRIREGDALWAQRHANADRSHYLTCVLGYGVCALLCLGGILVSFSRGAWVGAGAALIVLVLPYARRLLRSRLLASLLVGGCAVALVGTLMFALRGGPAGGSTTVRLLFWRESLALVRRHPLGLGLDQFFYYHHPAYGRSLIAPAIANTQERDARQPHNLLLEIWLNLGPLGVLACASLVARGVRRARASISPLTHGALAALAAALVHGTVDTFYFWPDLAIAFWLLLLVIEVSGVKEVQHRRLSSLE